MGEGESEEGKVRGRKRVGGRVREGGEGEEGGRVREGEGGVEGGRVIFMKE